MLTIEGLRATPDTLRLIQREFQSCARWDVRSDPERFTAREALAHLADWEEVFQDRLRKTLLQSPGDLPNPDPWLLKDENGYAAKPTVESVAAFAAKRTETLALLDTVQDADWAKAGHHPSRGPLTLDVQTVSILAHDAYHIRQLFALLSP